jgi:hypothetical protein
VWAAAAKGARRPSWQYPGANVGVEVGRPQWEPPWQAVVSRGRAASGNHIVYCLVARRVVLARVFWLFLKSAMLCHMRAVVAMRH